MNSISNKGLSINRYIKVLEIIISLNKVRKREGENYYNCGKLGIVHVWWQDGWKWNWIEISLEFLEEE